MWKQTIFLVFVALLTKEASSSLKKIQAHVTPSKGRIIGGQEVEPHSVPFQAGLIINGNGFCSGVLISPNYVLTAGHCGIVMTTVDVFLGSHNISNSAEATRVIIRGSKVIMHPDYDDETLRNDITLVELAEPAPINDYIQLAKFPPRSDLTDTYLNQIALATGWGLYQDIPFPSVLDLSDVLLGVEVPVSNLTECGMYYNDEDGDYVVESNVCTSGYRNKGTCNGDSGGPLTLNGVLIGVTSFGTTLCEVCSPSVYTRVVNYLDWIAANSDVEIP